MVLEIYKNVKSVAAGGPVRPTTVGGAGVGLGVPRLSTGCWGSRGRPPPQDSAPAHGGSAIYTAEPGVPFIGNSLCAPPEARAKLPLTLCSLRDRSLSERSPAAP